MKLSLIPGHESTVKQAFSFKKSTVALLQQYHALYMQTTGIEVPVKDVVEQMLLDFIQDDKAFQKALRTSASPGAVAAPARQVATQPPSFAMPAEPEPTTVDEAVVSFGGTGSFRSH